MAACVGNITAAFPPPPILKHSNYYRQWQTCGEGTVAFADISPSCLLSSQDLSRHLPLRRLPPSACIFPDFHAFNLPLWMEGGRDMEEHTCWAHKPSILSRALTFLV